jgi:hypothetical protein
MIMQKHHDDFFPSQNSSKDEIGAGGNTIELNMKLSSYTANA